MNKISFKTQYYIIIIFVLSFISIAQSCSKDDKQFTQEELVTLSNEYKNVLEQIASAETLISQLTTKLETAVEAEKTIIQAQIKNETEKLDALKKQRIDLENKLGIKN